MLTEHVRDFSDSPIYSQLSPLTFILSSSSSHNFYFYSSTSSINFWNFSITQSSISYSLALQFRTTSSLTSSKMPFVRKQSSESSDEGSGIRLDIPKEEDKQARYELSLARYGEGYIGVPGIYEYASSSPTRTQLIAIASNP